MSAMTEAQAWRAIARQWAEFSAGERYIYAIGTCPLIGEMAVAGEISGKVAESMRSRIKWHLEYGGHPFFDTWIAYKYTGAGCTRDNAEARALAALWLALEAEEDAQ